MSNNAIIKKKTGQVIATNSEQTATVLVSKVKEHRLYHKKFRIDRKYLCHNANNEYKTGDLVEITTSKPISKRKHYIISKKINDTNAK